MIQILKNRGLFLSWIGTVLLFLVFTAALAGPAKGDDITYTITGTFGPTVPATLFTQPNESFVATFTLPVNPVVNSLFGVASVNPPITYSLNGTPIPFSACPGTTVCGVDFIPLSDGGGLDFLIFSGSQIPVQVPPDQRLFILMQGPQLFSGPVSAPTLLTGNFPIVVGGCCNKVNTSTDMIATASLTVATISAVPSVPEPSPLILLVAGLAIVGVLQAAKSLSIVGHDRRPKNS